MLAGPLLIARLALAMAAAPTTPAAGPTTPVAPATAEARLAVLVTAAAPIDPRRLADALRAYLDIDLDPNKDQHDIDVRRSDTAAPADLHGRLAEARRIGEAAHALTVVDVAPGPSGDIEIELCDLATDRAIVAEVPRTKRDEDLYRTLALKIQALLRAAPSEASSEARPPSAKPPTAVLAARPAADAAPPPRRLRLETGYALFALPLTSLALHGVGVTITFAPRPWIDLGLGSAALTSARADGRDVTVVATVVPVTATARLRALSVGRADLWLGPSLGVAYVAVSPASPTAAVRSARDALPAAGVDVEARLGFGAGAWLFVRAGALAVLSGAGYRVDGQLLVDTSRLEVAAGAGIGVGLW